MGFKAGSLKNYVYEWKSIGASDFVLNCLSDGVEFSFKNTVPSGHFKNHDLTYTQSQFIDTEILNL